MYSIYMKNVSDQ